MARRKCTCMTCDHVWYAKDLNPKCPKCGADDYIHIEILKRKRNAK